MTGLTREEALAKAPHATEEGSSCQIVHGDLLDEPVITIAEASARERVGRGRGERVPQAHRGT
jgi:hypothetical protein